MMLIVKRSSSAPSARSSLGGLMAKCCEEGGRVARASRAPPDAVPRVTDVVVVKDGARAIMPGCIPAANTGIMTVKILDKILIRKTIWMADRDIDAN